MKNEKISKAWQVTLITALNLLLLIAVGMFTMKAEAVKMGENGEWVMLLQQELGKEGLYSGKPDGNYSPSTRIAVRKFQKSHGLEATGEADYETMAALGLDATHESGYFAVSVQLLARFAQWKCGAEGYSEKLDLCREMLGRVDDAGYPDTIAANLLCNEFAGFCENVYTVEPDTQSLRAAFEALG